MAVAMASGGDPQRLRQCGALGLERAKLRLTAGVYRERDLQFRKGCRYGALIGLHRLVALTGRDFRGRTPPAGIEQRGKHTATNIPQREWIAAKHRRASASEGGIQSNRWRHPTACGRKTRVGRDDLPFSLCDVGAPPQQG